MSFATDLLVFYKAYENSITSVKTIFQKFSEMSELCINEGTYEVVMVGMQSGMKDHLINLSGFAEGNIPLKYLRIAIFSSIRVVMDYQIVVDQITTD